MKGKTKLRDLSETELGQKVRELREEVFNLRFQVSMAMAKNPARIGQARPSWPASRRSCVSGRSGSGAVRRGGEAC